MRVPRDFQVLAEIFWGECICVHPQTSALAFTGKTCGQLVDRILSTEQIANGQEWEWM